MIAQDLVQAAELALSMLNHRPNLLPVALDRLADETDRLLEFEGSPAAPFRDAGKRIANHLIVARAYLRVSPDQVLGALEDCLRQATLVLRLTEVLPLLPPPPLPAAWCTPARPRLAVIQGGRP
ncbi:hypothetical protein [Roseomonas indoligenes]|uniref:Uncharacterized protein n=1 Tax=Roseomonas indoligenes TaxID=2820811 RepID=A0A940S5E2_9PROT|nr:hypothetical protein [Pararoseomonas indoligenes]MBP0492850.1 hypothetical protein [Pararoseomonas indoligenes]